MTTETTTASHARAGSYATPVGHQRLCTCGRSFFGTPVSTFEERDHHIETELAREEMRRDGEAFAAAEVAAELRAGAVVASRKTRDDAGALAASPGQLFDPRPLALQHEAEERCTSLLFDADELGALFAISDQGTDEDRAASRDLGK